MNWVDRWLVIKDLKEYRFAAMDMRKGAKGVFVGAFYCFTEKQGFEFMQDSCENYLFREEGGGWEIRRFKCMSLPFWTRVKIFLFWPCVDLER